MTILTDAQLRDKIATDLPDNTTGLIEPADIRNVLIDQLDTLESWYAKVTISSSPPSGGSDGDVWYQIV